MNAEQFCQHAAVNQTLADYLDKVAKEARPKRANRSFALEALFGVAAYALYRLAKNYLDHQRGLNEAELREQMLGQVRTLEANGWDKDKALATVMKVAKEVATLRPDSPALKDTLEVLGKGPTE
jgi:hypothetical protein